MIVQDKEDGLDLLSQLERLEAMSRQDKLVGCFLCNRLHEKRANGLVIFDDQNSPRLLLLLLLSHPHCSSFFSRGYAFFTYAIPHSFHTKVQRRRSAIQNEGQRQPTAFLANLQQPLSLLQTAGSPEYSLEQRGGEALKRGRLWEVVMLH